jgi:hypothetical protein
MTTSTNKTTMMATPTLLLLHDYQPCLRFFLCPLLLVSAGFWHEGSAPMNCSDSPCSHSTHSSETEISNFRKR